MNLTDSRVKQRKYFKVKKNFIACQKNYFNPIFIFQSNRIIFLQYCTNAF